MKDGTTETFSSLFVAGDPQDQIPSSIMPKTKLEQAIFSKKTMTSFTFQTTLIKFPKLPAGGGPTVRFAPERMDITDGSVYGYRSETRKEANYLATSASGSSSVQDKFNGIMAGAEFEYVTIYQLLDPTKHGQLTEKAMWEKLDKEMNGGLYNAWFLYDWSKGEKLKRFHTKYFNHFELQALQTHPNNWDLLNIQGRKNTVYVHASTAFESVLHIYWYIDQLTKSHSEVFPEDKESEIAVVGAGPSGLLIARKLSQMGYSNVKVFEQKRNDNGPDKLYAGKTQTNNITTLDKTVPAELGTCYLSPAYDEMIKDFKDTSLISKDQERVSFDQVDGGPPLRELVTAGQFSEFGAVMTLFRHIGTAPATEKGLDRQLSNLSRTDPKFCDWIKTVPFKQSRSQSSNVQQDEEADPAIPVAINFEYYQRLRGFEAEYEGQTLTGKEAVEKLDGIDLKMAEAAVKYLVLHRKFFGVNRPFATRKGQVNKILFELTIPKFLEKYDLKCLLGLLQYGYSVQGYGSTAPDSTMPAFYLLMWVTPAIFIANIGNKIKDLIKGLLPKIHFVQSLFSDEAIVTAFTKGWGDVWKNLKVQFDDEKSGVKIFYNSQIVGIKRDKVVSKKVKP